MVQSRCLPLSMMSMIILVAGTQPQLNQSCQSAPTYELANILDENIAGSYANFRVEISVFYDQNMDGVNDNAIGTLKRVELNIFGGNNQYTLAAYKGNY